MITLYFKVLNNHKVYQNFCFLKYIYNLPTEKPSEANNTKEDIFKPTLVALCMNNFKVVLPILLLSE